MALHDDADNPRFVETVPRKGYRFIAPVSIGQYCPVLEDVHPAAGVDLSEATRSRVASVVPKTAKRWWVLAFVAFLVVSVAWWYASRSHRSNLASTRKVIAVLPFSNEGAGPYFDYLRYAIANDLVTDLTHAHSVSVRPFASTSRYASQPNDPAALGKELRVTYVLAGGYLLDKRDLRVHLELVDVALDQPVFRSNSCIFADRFPLAWVSESSRPPTSLGYLGTHSAVVGGA